jgi:hypothetical protein
MRHALGVLGVLAAGVLLAVSAAMNWRFGYSLGQTEMDGQIYGAASAAADCLKALIPFFFFAALKNRMWSQATASAIVWVVVTGFSLTSALGHAAQNRLNTAGQRTVEAQVYKDLRADLKRAQDELSWIPQHRPTQTVAAEIEGLKKQRLWTSTNGCVDIPGKTTREFCQQHSALTAELASAQRSGEISQRITGIHDKLGAATRSTVLSEADPQAAVLAKVASIFGLSMKTEDVQTALTIFIAVLLEVGSGLGMYVAFSTWRINERMAPAAPQMATLHTREIVAAPDQVPAMSTNALPQPALARPKSGANDNKSLPQTQTQPRLVAPENDVQKFYKEKVETHDGSSVTATALYEDYCAWCEELKKEPLALPTFSREFGELGVQKGKIAGRVRYIGIALKSGLDGEEDKKPPVFDVKAA